MKKLGLSWAETFPALVVLGATKVDVDFGTGWALPQASHASLQATTSSTYSPAAHVSPEDEQAAALAAEISQFLYRPLAQAASQSPPSSASPPDDAPQDDVAETEDEAVPVDSAVFATTRRRETIEERKHER